MELSCNGGYKFNREISRALIVYLISENRALDTYKKWGSDFGSGYKPIV